MQFWLSALGFILSVLLAYQCSQIAKHRGRDTTLWFMAGAFFGLFALLVLLFLPARRSRVKPLRTPSLETPPTLFQALSTLHKEKFWYFLDEQHKQYGPMSFTALRTAWEQGTIQKHTFVWNEEMTDWKPLKEVVLLESSPNLR